MRKESLDKILSKRKPLIQLINVKQMLNGKDLLPLLLE